jgi:hypothetical protein
MAPFLMHASSKGRLDYLSTPNGCRGFFYNTWTKGGPDWKRIEGPCSQVPHIGPAYLEEERRTLPPACFRQEYEFSFETRGGVVYPTSSRAWSAGLSPRAAPTAASTSMGALIAGSPEYFQKRGGGTNDGFLNALYMNGLGRAVDPAGQAAWDQALATGSSRTQVAAGIFSSPEYELDLVKNYYTTYLRRQADPAGLNAWAALLLGGVKDQQVLADIVASAEYLARVA